MLVTVTLNMVYVLIVQAKPQPLPHRPTCPDCGGPLICIGFLPPISLPLPFDTR